MNKKYIIILSLFAFIVLLITFRKPIKMEISKLSRGYKNRNPGNIVLTKEKWKGEISGPDKKFKTFINMEYGYRGIFIVLQSYFEKGFNTIEKIINRYAPPSENVTSNYVKFISDKTGIKKDTKIDWYNLPDIKKIVAAISQYENDIVPDPLQIEAGYKLLMTA
jgi:hypothetical protein